MEAIQLPTIVINHDILKSKPKRTDHRFWGGSYNPKTNTEYRYFYCSSLEDAKKHSELQKNLPKGHIPFYQEIITTYQFDRIQP